MNKEMIVRHMFQQVYNQSLVCHVWVVIIPQITFKLPSIHAYELHHHSSGTMSEVTKLKAN